MGINTFFLLFLAAMVMVTPMGCTGSPEEPSALTLFCGAANKPAMEEIAALFENEHGIEVNLILGGSGSLLSQIGLSKKGEIYIPGSPDYIIIAERKKLIFPGSDRIVAYLVPAIITPKGNPGNIHSLQDLTRPGVRVGIGNPETVCLGLYGVELFERNSMLDEALANVVTFGASCSKLATLAAMGQVDAVLGWRVFRYWNPERMDWVPIAPEKIPRISYIPIAIPVHSRDRKLSEAFIDFVVSPRCKAIYEKFGYLTDLEEAKGFAPDAKVGGEYTLPRDYFNRIKTLWEKE